MSLNVRPWSMSQGQSFVRGKIQPLWVRGRLQTQTYTHQPILQLCKVSVDVFTQWIITEHKEHCQISTSTVNTPVKCISEKNPASAKTWCTHVWIPTRPHWVTHCKAWRSNTNLLFHFPGQYFSVSQRKERTPPWKPSWGHLRRLVSSELLFFLWHTSLSLCIYCNLYRMNETVFFHCGFKYMYTFQ